MKKILSFLLLMTASFASFSQVRISQVYGGGNLSGATYRNDFVELFNAGTTSVSLTGTSIQYGGAGSTQNFTGKLNLTGSIQAGGYYLIQLSGGTANGIALPTADQTGSIDMAGASGKVAFVNSTTALSGVCPTLGANDDLVSYGTAACNETGNTANNVGTLSSATAAIRKLNGCQDNNNNLNDFTVGAPSPRNSATTPNPCSAGTPTLSISPNLTLNSIFGANSTEGTFTVSGTDLTAGSLTVNSTGNVEIATASGGSFSNSITLTATAGTYSSGLLYARIKNTAPLGPLSETITVLPGAGASNSPSITVTGTVLSPEPTVQAADVVFSGVTNSSFTANWTNGNGSSRLVILRLTSASDIIPADGTAYTANTAFGQGATTGSGNYVVYNGTGTGPVTVTGLTAGTSYTVEVYEYNGSSTNSNYLTSVAGTNNPAIQVTTGTAPVNTVLQQDFIGISVPLYIGTGAANRLPAMFYATVNNLSPNTNYRYFVLGSLSSDIGSTTNGAGLPVLIDYNNGNAFSIPSSPSIAATTASGNFGTFTTNSAGSFTGSFGLVPSGNAKFTAGNALFPLICLGVDNGTATVAQQRLQLDQSMTVINIGTASNEATFIKGSSSASPKNLVALWKSIDGSSFVAATARPLSITYAENVGATIGSVISQYDVAAGAWNTLIPNTNPNGVRLIQQLDLVTGATVGCNSDADGTWPDSGTITADPSGGITPLHLTSIDAPLTAGACFSIVAVKYEGFTAVKTGSRVKLSWITEQEVNSNYTEVLRSTDGVNWKLIATVQGAGNSAAAVPYSVFDNAPVAGRNLYQLKYTDANNRSAYSEVKTVLFSDKFEISISPNPVRDLINVNIAKQQGNEPVMITLLNSNGKVMGNYSTTSSFYSINAAGLAKGLYILRLSNGENTVTEKLIIQ